MPLLSGCSELASSFLRLHGLSSQLRYLATFTSTLASTTGYRQPRISRTGVRRMLLMSAAKTNVSSAMR